MALRGWSLTATGDGHTCGMGCRLVRILHPRKCCLQAVEIILQPENETFSAGWRKKSAFENKRVVGSLLNRLKKEFSSRPLTFLLRDSANYDAFGLRHFGQLAVHSNQAFFRY